MPKTMKLGDMLAENLCAVADSLRKLADTVAAMTPASAAVSQDDSATDDTTTQKPHAAALKLEDVRAVLAEKSRAGYTAEVRELLLKHGAPKLSEIDSERYQLLLKDAEVLGNG